MRLRSMAAVALLAGWVAGCSGSSTNVGITVTPNPVTVLLNNSVQFAATVTGVSTTTVTWQVCLPASSSSSTTTTPPPPTTKPTDCTTVPGVQTPSGETILTGYGVIQQNGLYTAPAALPSPDTAVILVTSTVDSNGWVTVPLTIDSGIRVQVTPLTATIGPLESFQFTANVTAPDTVSNKGVTWTLSITDNSNPPPLGTISPAGLYTAPAASPGAAVTVTATSAADPTKSGAATVTVSSGGAPTLTAIDPSVAAQGSVEQDLYLTGTNFESTSEVVVTAPNQLPVTLPATSVFFLSPTLMRATLPLGVLSTAGSVSIQVESQAVSGNVSGSVPLTVFPVRPALVAASPDNVSQNSASAAVGLTGGYFSGATSATVNGSAVGATLTGSQQLSVTLPAGVLATPGLYPIVVTNAGIPSDQPSLSALNVAVTPAQASIPGAPNGTPLAVGTSPSAVAVDEADGLAVVANTGSNSVTLVNVTTGTTVGAPIPVGTSPTGVAVDDLLSDPVALVVNNADQTVTGIDLKTEHTTTLSVSISSGANPPLPYSIGVNPLTHRAIVVYQLGSLATILDVSDSAGTPGLSIVQTIGGTSSNFTGTGQNPAVAVDPRLNWAVVTPGGAGEVNIVDLGQDAVPGGAAGRNPEAIADLLISQTVQGVGINPETHEAFLSDPDTGTLYTFSMLNNVVTTVTQPSSGNPNSPPPLSVPGFGAAAATGLDDVGIAVNKNSTAVVVDLANAVVLQNISGLGASTAAQAVAVDPATNEAIVVNHDVNSVSIVSLGTTLNPLQITEASPAIVFGGPGTSNLTLTILGGGFLAGTSEVVLDGTALPAADVNVVSGREILATVPGAMLGSARRYIVQVQNGAGGAVSNVTDLSVVQPIAVGNLPVGVAVDTDRDAAVTTNSADDTVSLISLAPISSESPESLGNVGVIGSPVLVGTTPEGVAVIPRLGLAVVANNGSNNSSVVDVTGVLVPVTVQICASSGCSAPTGATVNQDTATAVITSTNPTTAVTSGTVSTFTLPSTGSVGASVSVDHDPVAAAVDPTLDYAAIATASQSSSVNLINLATYSTIGTVSTGLENPSGIIFDPVNQVFLAANSLLNNVVLIDPVTFAETPVNVGIAPTSLDYNFQTSTLVTANSPSGTLSILNYVCPPVAGAPAACVGPEVRTVLGLGGTQTSPLALGANAVAVDPKLNLAVLVDPDNNRVLLVPLPH